MMLKFDGKFVCVCLASYALAVSGCTDKTPPIKESPKPAVHEHHEGDGHDHSKDDLGKNKMKKEERR